LLCLFALHAQTPAPFLLALFLQGLMYRHCLSELALIFPQALADDADSWPIMMEDNFAQRQVRFDRGKGKGRTAEPSKTLNAFDADAFDASKTLNDLDAENSSPSIDHGERAPRQILSKSGVRVSGFGSRV
jgi:hypothetical protein